MDSPASAPEVQASPDLCGAGRGSGRQRCIGPASKGCGTEGWSQPAVRSRASGERTGVPAERPACSISAHRTNELDPIDLEGRQEPTGKTNDGGSEPSNTSAGQGEHRKVEPCFARSGTRRVADSDGGRDFLVAAINWEGQEWTGIRVQVAGLFRSGACQNADPFL